jgi:hypothetical protein
MLPRVNTLRDQPKDSDKIAEKLKNLFPESCCGRMFQMAIQFTFLELPHATDSPHRSHYLQPVYRTSP